MRNFVSSVWFFDCKLHVAMNTDRYMASTELSDGCVADIKMVEDLVEGFKVTIYIDRNHIGQSFEGKCNCKSLI
ncbi:transposase [Acinetobacter pollinis]|uniref:transposase n=1 Tax=Acinetobacter pollinis TaxID=2605270 RepID=UPI002B1BD49E|nr:transposase [Acinetobacter pollinis]